MHSEGHGVLPKPEQLLFCCSSVSQNGHLSSEGVWYLRVHLAGQATLHEGPGYSFLWPTVYLRLILLPFRLNQELLLEKIEGCSVI